MAAGANDFPFGIMDVASLLRLRIRRRLPDSVYADCPFCGDNRGKMNINHVKNVFRCNYCDEHGGMIALYARATGIGGSDAYREICEALCAGAPTSSQPFRENAVIAASVEKTELAGVYEIHQTLSMLLSFLNLSDAHRQNLRDRGLTDEQINRLGYKSTPPPYLCKSYTERLMKQGCTVKGVPGFYLDDDGKWTAKFHMRTAGIILPARGIDGLIQGAQIRLDTPIKDENDCGKTGTKYLWFSSSNKRMGVTSGSPVHFVGDPFASTVYVTEGILKGDVAHYLMNRTFACVAGANNLSRLDPLLGILARNGTKLIVEAHDMDKYANEMITKGASRIYVMANQHGMESRRLTWNPNYKGVDDWQLSLRKKEEKSMIKKACTMNFRDYFMSGLCGFEALDEYVAAWTVNSMDMPLREFLGLTEQEFETYSQGGNLEALLLSQRKIQRFKVYQLEFGSDIQPKPWAFGGIDELHKAGYEQPPAAEYRLVHVGEIRCDKSLTDNAVLGLIYEYLNDDLPDGYHGRSVSLSDVIELFDDDSRRYYYCDRLGFAEVNFSPRLALPMKTR